MEQLRDILWKGPQPMASARAPNGAVLFSFTHSKMETPQKRLT